MSYSIPSLKALKGTLCRPQLHLTNPPHGLFTSPFTLCVRARARDAHTVTLVTAQSSIWTAL